VTFSDLKPQHESEVPSVHSTLTRLRPPLLHGELTADGRRIVLIGTGPDPAIAQMAAARCS
jgi:hypothetical protein